MTEAKRKALALLMSVVLAFSMTSATALTAFGAELSAAGITLGTTLGTQAAASGEVYDTVYGIIGGKYAIMEKTVVSEREYLGSVQKDVPTTATDIVSADGKVVLHTSNATKGTKSETELPGKWTDLEFAGFRVQDIVANGKKVASGYVQVKNKSTKKQGIRKLDDGSELVPCSYDSVSVGSDAFVGFNFGSNSISVKIIGFDGSNLGSTTIDSTAFTSSPSAYMSWVGDYAIVDVHGNTASGWTNSQTILKKSGSSYQKDSSITKVLSWRQDGLVVMKTDGYAYYLPTASTNAVKLGTLDSDGYARVNGSLIELSGSNGTAYYTLGGAKVDFGGKSYVGPAGDYFIAKDSESYAVYDTNGRTVSSGEAYDVCAPGGDCYVVVKRTEHEEEVLVYDDGEDQEYEYEYTYTYKADLYGAPSTLKKSLFEITTEDSDAWGYAYSLTTYDGSKESIYGYQISFDDTTRYYDANWNEVSERPSAPSQSADSSSPQLMFGKKAVTAYVNGTYKDGKTTYSAVVTDSAGSPVKSGNYTLGIAIVGTSYVSYNKVKHGNADIWWATDKAGKWGAIDSSGKVKVKFEYESYFDAGDSDTNFALVKKGGAWSFINVNTGALKAVPALTATASGPTKVNPMVVKAKSPTVKFAKLKKGNQTVKASAAYNFTKKAKGTVTYTRVAKGSAKGLTVNKKTGSITVKKGLKKGTYKVNVSVKAAGDKTYKSASKKLIVKVKVK